MVAVAGILAFTIPTQADTILRQQSFDLTQVTNPAVFTLNNSKVLGIGTDNEGLTAAQMLFPAKYSSLGRCSTTVYQDWSPYNILEVKMTNHDAVTANFRIGVWLTSNPNNMTGMFSAPFSIGPNETRRYCFYLNNDDPITYGFKYMRPVLTAPFNSVYCSGAFRNLKTIYNWRFSYQGGPPVHIDVSDLRLIKQDMTFDGLVDAFGQYTDRTWPNKITSQTDLQTQLANEQTDLAANPGPGEQTGTTKLVNDHPVPGQWAVVTQNSGKAYLQHPNGNLFWSLGVSAIGTGAPTPVGGRQSDFLSLPDSTSQLSTFYCTKPTMDGTNTCYSFHVQNLSLKYGMNYVTPWVSTVKKRLASWGLNTVGMQSASQFTDNSMPYTQIVYTDGFSTRLRVPYQAWGTLPDPYDSNFQSWMVTNFGKALAPYNGQSNFMGVFVDNEMSWGYLNTDKTRYNIEMGILKSPSSQPAKVALVQYLQGRYNSIGALNSAWGTSFSSFNSILNGTWVPSKFPLPSGMAQDFVNFTPQFATKYFSAVRGALNQIHLSGLYLGCRFSQCVPEVVNAADNYVDVESFNFYRTADKMDWGYLGSLKRPYLLSECGFSVKADGTFGGVGEIYSQADRAAALTNLLNAASAQPDCVGAIIYCYTDQPITGRYTDYENSGLGLVDITDTPHYEAVNALRNFSQTLYANRGQ